MTYTLSAEQRAFWSCSISNSFAMFEEIASMFDEANDNGRQAKCVAALRRWVWHQRFLRYISGAAGETIVHHPTEAMIKLIPSAGAAALQPAEIRRLQTV